MEEEIVKLSFDELRPETIRLGGSSGTIAYISPLYTLHQEAEYVVREAVQHRGSKSK